MRRATEQFANDIDQPVRGQPQPLGRLHRQDRRQAVEVRHLRDHRRGAHAVGHRDHMTTRQGRSPQGDAIRIHLGPAAGVLDRGDPVLVLACDVEQLSRLARARAEVAVVEDQHMVTRGDKALGVEPATLPHVIHFQRGASRLGPKR